MFAPLNRCLATVILLAALPFDGSAQQADALRGATLSAASNLSQGRQADVLRLTKALGVLDLRDGMNWSLVERQAGQYRFDTPRTGFPTELGQMGLRPSVVLNWGNPLYQGGETPTSATALAAFGAYAAHLVQAMPMITELEIGNEFNGINFVKGPLKSASPKERAIAHVGMLGAAATAARAARPDIIIAGGATHSIPAGFLWDVLDAGGAKYMDRLAIHPYTTDPEQLVRQLSVLRRHPDARALPIEVTEFGITGAERAPSYFLRHYCQMSLAGITRAAWYPLNQRGDGLVPLFTPDGRITTAGRTYRLIAARLEEQPVVDIAPDAFTYGCRFGDDTYVVWGAERPLGVPGGAQVLNAMGAKMRAPYRITPDAPLVVVMPPDSPGLAIPDSGVIADSYDQYGYPAGDEILTSGDAFERFVRIKGRERPLITLPGQERAGTPWVPYRGNPDLGAVRLMADRLIPAGRGDQPADIVHRYTAPTAMTVALDVRATPTAKSADGVRLIITHNGALIQDQAGKTAMTYHADALTLAAGDQIEVSIGPNGTAKGDITAYRITLARN